MFFEPSSSLQISVYLEKRDYEFSKDIQGFEKRKLTLFHDRQWHKLYRRWLLHDDRFELIASHPICSIRRCCSKRLWRPKNRHNLQWSVLLDLLLRLHMHECWNIFYVTKLCLSFKYYSVNRKRWNFERTEFLWLDVIFSFQVPSVAVHTIWKTY